MSNNYWTLDAAPYLAALTELVNYARADSPYQEALLAVGRWCLYSLHGYRYPYIDKDELTRFLVALAQANPVPGFRAGLAAAANLGRLGDGLDRRRWLDEAGVGR